MVVGTEIHSDNAVGSASRAAYIRKPEVDRHSEFCKEHGLVIVSRLLHLDQKVVFTEVYGYKTVFVDIGIFRKLRLLCCSVVGCHEEVFVLRIILHRDHRSDLFIRLQGDKVHNRDTSRSP